MGIAVAGATYSVNIELNHQSLNKQLDDLGTKVQGIGKKAANKASGTKEETDSLRKQNNILTSNALTYGKSLRLKKQGKDIDEKTKTYKAAMFAAEQGEYNLAKDLISINKLANAEHQNQLIVEKDIVKAKGKSLGVSRQMAESIDAMDKAQHKNFALRTKLDDLERKGVNVYQERLKYGQLNAAQGNREFGSVKKIASSLDLDLKRKAAKFRWQNKINQATAKELEIRRKMGGATSPIRGDAIRDVGSPAWVDRSARMGGPSSKLNYQRGHLLPGPVGTGGLPGAGSKVWQSAAISGAFPLLFGQGPVTAAAGALGGGLGAKFGGQMGGFAGGLAATAAISTIGNAVNAVKELGQAMGPFTQDTSALITATGQANTFREKELNLIAELKGKQEAFNEAMKDMTKLVGQKGVEALKQFGEDTKRLSDDWARFMTQMSAGLARLINWSGILKQGRKATVNKARGADYADDEEMQRLLGRVDVLSGKRRTGSVNAELLKIEKDIKERILYLDEQNVIAQDKKLAKMEAQAERLKSLDSLYKDIGGTIKDGLVQGIQAAIDGTKSLGEIAGNVFRKISNALLDFGVSMALANLPIPGAKKFFGNYANGGRPPKGRPSIVGERGPELFVPDSAGTIIPNHEMGGTNVVVNVDASGSAVQGDGGQAEELGSMLAAAVQAEIANQQRPGGLLAGTR